MRDDVVLFGTRREWRVVVGFGICLEGFVKGSDDGVVREREYNGLSLL